MAGSSPLTRGALSVIMKNATASGIIPAHAGSTHRNDQPPP